MCSPCFFCQIEVSFLCLAVDGVENAMECSSEQSTGGIESGFSEKPKDADSVSDNSNESNVAGCAEGTENTVETITPDDSVDLKLVKNCQPEPAPPTSSELHATAEVLPSTDSAQPDPPEVSVRKKKQTSGTKKKSQKQKGERASSEGTWKVSSREDTERTNVVLIRRQHPTEVLDTCRDLASSPVEEVAKSAVAQSQVSCKTNCDMEDINLSDKIDEGVTIQEHAASVDKESAIDSMNMETIDTTGTSADDTLARNDHNVDSVASTDGQEVTRNQSKKRRRKIAAEREGCRKSQRCSSRRQNAEESVSKTSASACNIEVRTADLCERAQKANNETLPCSDMTSQEVPQEQVVSARNNATVAQKTDLVVAVSSIVASQTEASMGLSDPALLTSSSAVATPSDNITEPIEPFASTENTDLVSVTKLKLPSTASIPAVPHSLDDRAQLNSPTHNSSSPDDIHSTSPTAMEIDPPVNSTENDMDTVAVNGESDSCLAADMCSSSQPSNDASLLNTCSSQTILETLASPEEHNSHSSDLQLHTDKEPQNAGVAETCSSSGAASGDESESEEVCKTVLEEVVANVAKEAFLLLTARENVEDIDSLTESVGSWIGCTTQNESDNTSGEIPLKKRRGRRVFADSQMDNSSTRPHRSDDVRRATVSSGHRRKTPKTNSLKHAPRGSKYVGGHTSVIGKLLGRYHTHAHI